MIGKCRNGDRAVVRFLLSGVILFVSNGSIGCRLIHGEHLDVLFERVHGIYPFNRGYFPHCIHQFALDTCSSGFLLWIVSLLSLQHIPADLSCSLISNNEYYRRKSVNHGTTVQRSKHHAPGAIIDLTENKYTPLPPVYG